MGFSGSKGTEAKMKKVETMTGTEKKLFKKMLKQIDPKSFDLSKNKTFMRGQDFVKQMLDPSSEAYQKFEAPYMRQFNEEIVPGVAERFSQYDAQDSSAFNQSMGQAASSLSERLAALRTQSMGAASNQALQYGTAQAGVYGSLYGQSLGSSPYAYQVMPGQNATEGWGGGAMSGIAQGAGTIGTAAMLAKFAPALMASSEIVKENIRPYDKGLDVINSLDVKIYDYKDICGGSKDRVGVIAETVPMEIQGEIEGIKAVDLYGLIGILINSVKELSSRIETIEQRGI